MLYERVIVRERDYFFVENVRYGSGDRERVGLSLILMVLDIFFIWVGGLRNIYGVLNYVWKIESYKEIWKILLLFVKWWRDFWVRILGKE